MLKLLLDENVSPALCRLLWEYNVDTVALRDRGLLQVGDHTVWRLGQDEDRSVVTINAGDFRRLARQTPDHSGLIVLPSGHPRDGQFRMIVGVIQAVHAENVILPSLRGRIFEIDDEGGLHVEGILGLSAFDRQVTKG